MWNGSQNGDYEDYCHLWCDVVQFAKLGISVLGETAPIFRVE